MGEVNKLITLAENDSSDMLRWENNLRHFFKHGRYPGRLAVECTQDEAIGYLRWAREERRYTNLSTVPDGRASFYVGEYHMAVVDNE